MSMSRDQLADIIRAKLEGHAPLTDETEENEDTEQSAGENPPGLNSDGLLLGLASALGFDATSINTL